ncbi:MAG TPA: hypothetical protein PLO65_09320 [Caulobacter sp.]|nr:hypothetical protein [Caulobacter sp.]
MDWQNTAFIAAGAVGGITAAIHGVLIERLMARPFDTILAGDRRVSLVIRRLVAPLLHYSTISWLLGGLVLIAAAVCPFSPDARLAVGLMVGSHFLYGALGNAWATRGRHPGWMLMALAVGLIAWALYGT